MRYYYNNYYNGGHRIPYEYNCIIVDYYFILSFHSIIFFPLAYSIPGVRSSVVFFLFCYFFIIFSLQENSSVNYL